MSTVTQATPAPWQAAHAAVQKATASGPQWLREARQQAFARFEAHGLPTAADERWRHTPLRHLADADYRLGDASGIDHLTAQDLMPYTFHEEAARLVFVDGHYAAEFSHARGLPEGVTLGRTFEHLGDARVRDHLTRAADTDNPMAALNLALARDGAYLHIPKGTTIEHPIHFLFITTEADAAMMVDLHNILIVEAHAEASLVESHVGSGRAPTFTNVTTWIAAGLRAHVDHVKVQREPAHATHVASQIIEQHRDSTVRSIAVSLGAAICRQDIEATMLQEGAHCDLQGLFLGTEDQRVDYWTRVEHMVPHCSSHERFKGILGGRARGAFTGGIVVHPGAVGSSSQQENRNLLLSRDAHVDTTPQLEIHNDDVRCSHGSTIGQLDEEVVFFLQSRGIDKEAARIMLTHAFAQEIIDEISDGTIRKGLDGMLARWFQDHAATAEAN